MSDGNPVVNFRIRIGAVQLKYYLDTGAYINTVIAGPTMQLGSTYYPFALHQLYTPVMLLQLTELFTKYKWTRLCFEYVPRVSGGTSSPFALTWAYSDDPQYPFSHSWTNAALTAGFAYTPTESQLASMEGAKQFPAWQPFACMDVTKHLDKKEWMFLANPFYDDVSPQLYGDTAALRQSCPGVLAISGSENTFTTSGTDHTATTVTVGTLFYSGSLVLNEFNPPINNDSPDLTHCSKPMRKTWKACPQCGELLTPKVQEHKRSRSPIKESTRSQSLTRR